MTTTTRAHIFFMETTVLPSGLRRHLSRKSAPGILVIGHMAGEEGLRHLLEAVIASHRHHADTVLLPTAVQPRAVAPIRGIFDDVATGAEFDFLPEQELLEALRSHDPDDRAVGASYSSEAGVMSFITGDRQRLVVPTSAIAPHPVMGEPDYAAIAVSDGGHTVTFGGDYEVAFDGLRYLHDPVYRAIVRKRARDKDRSFGGCLRRARFHMGLGQGDFGVSDRTIRRIETGTDGERDINRRTRQLIERHLGMKFDRIKTF